VLSSCIDNLVKGRRPGGQNFNVAFGFDEGSG
jgi:N-acetyl-gamma-glutamylphosphate reductase